MQHFPNERTSWMNDDWIRRWQREGTLHQRRVSHILDLLNGKYDNRRKKYILPEHSSRLVTQCKLKLFIWCAISFSNLISRMKNSQAWNKTSQISKNVCKTEKTHALSPSIQTTRYKTAKPLRLNENSLFEPEKSLPSQGCQVWNVE